MDFEEKITIGLSVITLVTFCFVIFAFGYIPHFKTYSNPFIQFPALLILTVTLFLQVVFFIGAIFIELYAEIELFAIILLISLVWIYYYLMLRRTIILESLKICASESFNQIKEHERIMIPKGYMESCDEMEDLNFMQEENSSINNNIKQISPNEFHNKCISYIFIRMRRFRHIKYFRCMFKDVVFTNEQSVCSFVKKYEILLFTCSFSLISIFLILLVLSGMKIELQPLIISLGVLKFILMLIISYEIAFLVGNFTVYFKHEKSLFSKLNCIRFLAFCFIIQNVVISSIGIRNILGLSLNFLLTSTENCLLGYFWVKNFGIWSIAPGKLKTQNKQIDENLI